MNIAKYNPFGSFREYQEDVIKQIIEIQETEIPNIILKAPVASGKSLIAYTAAEYLRHEQNKNSLIFTSTKFLQDQYLRDFPSLTTVKGRNNFYCLHNERTCDKGSCKEICDFSCNNAITPNLELKQSVHDSCPYWAQKINAINSPISIINYAFGLVDRNFVKHFLPRDFAIFDEAHNIEAELMNFLEVNISPRQLYKDIQYYVDVGLQDIKQWSQIFFEISDVYQDYAQRALSQENNKQKSDDFLSKSEKYRLTAFLIEDNPENWVIDIQDNNLVFKPILVSQYAEKSLLSFGKTRLFMSGSILKNNSFCEALNLDYDDTHIIEVPSIINPKQRPIYKEYAGSMSLKNRANNIDNIVNKILEIAERYPEDKGVVHTYTYTISNMIKDRIHNDRFIFHDSQNRQAQTQKFINSDEPKIFVSPYSFEGVDFKDDLARFQIVAKNPFPNMFGNNQYQQRDRISNFHWIFEQRCKVFSQMYGRIVRSPQDYGDTYLIDSDIQSLLGPSSLVTGYVLEGFVDSWINKEIVIIDDTKLSQDKRRSYETERFNERIILDEIKKMSNPTVTKLIELYKNLPNDAYKEIRDICERLLKNQAISLR